MRVLLKDPCSHNFTIPLWAVRATAPLPAGAVKDEGSLTNEVPAEPARLEAGVRARGTPLPLCGPAEWFRP